MNLNKEKVLTSKILAIGSIKNKIEKFPHDFMFDSDYPFVWSSLKSDAVAVILAWY